MTNFATVARLSAAVRVVCPDADISVGVIGNSATVTFRSNGTQAQKDAAQAVINAFDWTAPADAAWQLTQDRANAIAIFLADTSPSAKVLRGAILALVDQLNVIRAALPVPLAAITVAQAKTAIQNKINGGTVD